jgi:putative salt-induced outer membrane protein
MLKPSLLSFPLTLALTGTAAAQSPPDGLMQKNSATSGTTELASQGFEGATVPPEESKDATELSLNAGAFLSAGNARSIAATFAEQFRLRRSVHQFSLNAGVNYGRSAPDLDSDLETTVENYQGKARYDFFFTERLALFLGASARRDRFQGLALRLNVAPGAAYYFIDSKEQQLWTELGYNLQYDVRTDEALEVAADEGSVLDDSDVRHFGRLFVGYKNTLNETVTFDTGFEYLLGISPFRDDVTNRRNWRFSWTAGLNAKVSDKFSVATTVAVDYDNNPVPGVRRTDATTAINLVYALL